MSCQEGNAFCAGGKEKESACANQTNGAQISAAIERKEHELLVSHAGQEGSRCACEGRDEKGNESRSEAPEKLSKGARWRRNRRERKAALEMALASVPVALEPTNGEVSIATCACSQAQPDLGDVSQAFIATCTCSQAQPDLEDVSQASIATSTGTEAQSDLGDAIQAQGSKGITSDSAQIIEEHVSTSCQEANTYTTISQTQTEESKNMEEAEGVANVANVSPACELSIDSKSVPLDINEETPRHEVSRAESNQRATVADPSQPPQMSKQARRRQRKRQEKAAQGSRTDGEVQGDDRGVVEETQEDEYDNDSLERMVNRYLGERARKKCEDDTPEFYVCACKFMCMSLSAFTLPIYQLVKIYMVIYPSLNTL